MSQSRGGIVEGARFAFMRKKDAFLIDQALHRDQLTQMNKAIDARPYREFTLLNTKEDKMSKLTNFLGKIEWYHLTFIFYISFINIGLPGLFEITPLDRPQQCLAQLNMRFAGLIFNLFKPHYSFTFFIYRICLQINLNRPWFEQYFLITLHCNCNCMLFVFDSRYLVRLLYYGIIIICSKVCPGLRLNLVCFLSWKRLLSHALFYFVNRTSLNWSQLTKSLPPLWFVVQIGWFIIRQFI